VVRINVQLTKAQAEGLKALAARQGRSMADLIDLIGGGIDALLGTAGHVSREERRRRGLAVVGRYRSGPRDLSERHDRYLEKASKG
jgi:hypothetical protein